MKVINKADYYDEIAEKTPLTDKELSQFRPLKDVMPAEFVEMVMAHQAERERLGFITPQDKQVPLKQSVTLRLSPEILEKFRATGKGWQSRLNDVLLDYVKTAM
ncbi:hypothetical protein A4G20_06050 [Pasteurellaceae bacterium RH1A]|nr:hypothetical protein A4G20_06050 [Pasteurellaceae bacterium RH1A]